MAQTAISKYDGDNGRLFYRGGHPIEGLASRSFEEVAYLLWSGVLPDRDELNQLRVQLANNRELNSAARSALQGLQIDIDPMDALRTILSAQGSLSVSSKPDLLDAIQLAAVTPTAIASYYRHQRGLKPLAPRKDLDHASNLLYMLNGEYPRALATRALQTYLVIMADHGLNPSTFTARIVASTGGDLCSCIVAAICALKGSAHGGAIIGARRMVERMSNGKTAEYHVLESLERKERLMGFGHREYRTYDPRATILRNIAKHVNQPFYNAASKIENIALRELARRYPERPILTNVDYYAAGVLEAAGIPIEFFTCIFAASRIVGWTAHVLEYTRQGGRMISPTSQWVGASLETELDTGAHDK